MALSRTEQVALAIGAVIALGVPAALLWDHGVPAESVVAAPPALLAPASPPPLVSIGRRPLFGGSGEVAGDEAAPLPGDAPRLVGIAGRIGRDAIAMVRTDTASRSLSVGESIDGWTLESLAIDAAYFTRGSERLRVPLPAG